MPYRYAWILLILFLPVAAFAQNAVVLENQLPGTPDSIWDIEAAGDPEIQGFASDMSVDQGETIEFKIKTPSDDYRIEIYRLGWYNGDGARLVTTIQPSVPLPQIQPDCATDTTVNLVDCGNWDVSASWDVPVNAVSGLYMAKPVREDPGETGSSHIPFIVRDDDGNSDLLFQTSDSTWLAYNLWSEDGLTQGSNLYAGPDGKADKVSYNRPLTTRLYPPQNSIFNAEYAMIRWIERNGYDVSYFCNVDTERRGTEILEHQVFVSVGHDEYWSRGMRENVTAARDAGVHLAFFSGNEIYWKVRWEDSIDGSGTPFRTMVCYKEGTLGEYACDTKCDPVSDVWTGLWRDGCDDSPPADGCLPENALTGQMSWKDSSWFMTVPASYAHLPFWRNTNISTMVPGQTVDLPQGVLGYEWDFEQYEEYYPPRRIKLSETHHDGDVHHLSLYQADSGALVFGAGTIQWSWGLDDYHDLSGGDQSQDMQQATVNLFADMGVQPGTLQNNLVPAVPLFDTDPPVSTVTYPPDGSTIEAGFPAVITGTATDTGGSGVALVEISLDDGLTWQAASGQENWTFSWTPADTGSVTIRSRAMDSYFNMETPGIGTQVNIGIRVCPCTIWNDLEAPDNPDHNDSDAVELGVKFRTTVDGSITAIRFYKGPRNTGTHIGNLWLAADETLLGSVTFTDETATGWQEAALIPPVPVTAGVTYLVSYHAPDGYYAMDPEFFESGPVDRPPLRALGDGEDGPNGVFRYGPADGGMPVDSFDTSNYWVDVRFEPAPDPNAPPVISDPGPQVSAVLDSVSLQIVATDPEDHQLSYAATGLPDGLGIDAGTGLISGVVTCTAASDSVQVTVTDDGDPVAASTVSFEWTVNPMADPAALADLAAVQIVSNNDGDGTTEIRLNWTPPADPGVSVEIYRKEFGSYPEYDDGGGETPVLPLDTWTLVDTVSAANGQYDDDPPVRDFWYYAAVLVNVCGGTSAPSNLTAGTLNYHLGDVSDGQVPGQGDNLVSTLDVSLLGAFYATTTTPLTSHLDVGPTTDTKVTGRPVTDKFIEFEDLIIMAININMVSKDGIRPEPAARNALTVVVPPEAAAGQIEVQLQVAGDGSIKGMSVPLLWNPDAVRPVGHEVGGLATAQSGRVILLSPAPGTLDFVVLGGADEGLTGEGILATVVFEVLGAGDPEIRTGEIRARDRSNRALDLESTLASGEAASAEIPAVSVLHPNYPNPFNPMTTFKYGVAVRGRATLEIYDVQGRKVRTLLDTALAPGSYSTLWDGTDDGGQRISSGVYLARFRAVDRTDIRRVTLIK